MTASLAEQCRERLARADGGEAIEYAGRWHSWDIVRHIAAGVTDLLAAAGLPALAPVAFVPRNRPSAVAAELGMLAAGRTIAMIYSFQSPAGIARDIERLGLAAVVADADDFTPELLAVVRARSMAAIALDDEGAHFVEGTARRAGTPAELSARPEIRVHTSGTTGPPKHVALSHAMIARDIVGANIGKIAHAGAESAPSLLFYPLGNISGIYSALPALLSGRPIELLDRFNLDAWRRYVRRYRPALAGVPAGAIAMILEAEVPPDELRSITVMPTGAAPLDPAVQRAFEERYGIPILLSYGATEFGGPVTLMTPDDYAVFGAAKLGSVGRPFGGAEIRVIDPESGAELAPGSDGLLEVKAPRIGETWIRTTDIGMVDRDGFLFLRGRADGAIMRGGFKILPETIERALCEHPAVAAAAVVGVAHARLGQAPAAAVQLTPGVQTPSWEQLEVHLRDRVYATHIPTQWAVVDAIPRNPSFKIDIAAVRALFGAAGTEAARAPRG